MLTVLSVFLTVVSMRDSDHRIIIPNPNGGPGNFAWYTDWVVPSGATGYVVQKVNRIIGESVQDATYYEAWEITGGQGATRDVFAGQLEVPGGRRSKVQMIGDVYWATGAAAEVVKREFAPGKVREAGKLLSSYSFSAENICQKSFQKILNVMVKKEGSAVVYYDFRMQLPSGETRMMANGIKK